ncbi:MAG: CCA tRNA nucleotidyltransferase [Lactobacillales bacterium]|jgi:tRNA nucleotidyltransferase (CCA-adding enzyme)|nr:CCA tRNA nucleotidyltransferase [Lactobacillales bacterium]
MRIEKFPKEFIEAKSVLKTLEVAGYEAYFVGGSVRDVLLGKEIHDVDIATSAFPAEMKEIFPRTVDVGIEHGTVLILRGDEGYEITTFRTESTYQDFRRPDSVTFVRSLSEDLKRRDFTINAFALSDNGEIIDLFSGEEDLKNKLIRSVGSATERFHEDALRMMRAFRFASELDFKIEEQTLKAIAKNAPLLEKISVERIQIEFTKLLLGEHRKNGLLSFVETNSYLYVPMLTHQDREALLKFVSINETPFRATSQAWALLLYFLRFDERKEKSFLKNWKESNQVIHQTNSLLKNFRLRLENDWTNEQLYHLGLENALLTEELLTYVGKVPDVSLVEKKYKELTIHQRSELAVSGNDLQKYLNKKPGPWLGILIQEIEKKVVNGELPNDFDELISFAATQV